MVNPSWIEVDEFVYVAVQHSACFCAVQQFLLHCTITLPIHALIPLGISNSLLHNPLNSLEKTRTPP